MASDWTVLQLRASAHWIWCVKFLQMWALLTFPYTQISLGICSADGRHSPEKLEHKSVENVQAMPEKNRPQFCQSWQNQQQQVQLFGVRPTNATPVRPVLPNISSLACQAPPKARALCQKWQGSTLALKLVVWTPKATACCSDRWSWPECSTFQHWQPFRKHFTGSSFVTGCVTQIYVLRELTGCSAGTAHPQVWEP